MNDEIRGVNGIYHAFSRIIFITIKLFWFWIPSINCTELQWNINAVELTSIKLETIVGVPLR